MNCFRCSVIDNTNPMTTLENHSFEVPFERRPNLTSTSDGTHTRHFWKNSILEMVTHEIQKITINVFYLCSLFQTHPEVQDAFLPFQQLSKEDMEHSAILRSHALRVMGTVEKCIGRIKTPEKLENLMHELGERHTHYNARYDFVDVRSFSLLLSTTTKKLAVSLNCYPALTLSF